MSETVCVTMERLREIELQTGVDGWRHWCPVCGRTKEDGHAPDCWLGNAIAQAERLKDWRPEVGDLVRLKTKAEIKFRVVKYETQDEVIVIREFNRAGVFNRESRYHDELMPAEES